ncbi:unnamed protein product [Vicia faba]|uniref:Uncharacterized protein n=1 Tax=Vicia faba TaxID=3906 RepID=A0AAV1B8F8_VICFA|nr:unnamed protein product [Vicia faba]
MMMNLSPKLLQMFFYYSCFNKRTKCTATKKNKSSENISTSEKESFMYESMNTAKEPDSNSIRKNIVHVETNVEEPHVEPHVESHVDSHVEPNVETCVPTSG